MMRALAAASLLMLFACGEPSTGPGEAGSSSAATPNLVLITMDTTRADALGSYGQPLETSPNIDALAARGALFEHVTSSHPETLPSHATLFTGQWPFVHGVRSNAGYLLADRNRTLAEVLRENGYLTAAEVAAPVLRRETRVAQGFDQYRGAESPGVELKVVRYAKGAIRQDTREMRIGADITRKGVDFIRRHRDEKFFLWLHYFDAHSPYSAPAVFNRKIPESPYHAEVASADFQIGVFLKELARLGLQDRTLVVLTADHGEGLDEHGEPSHSFFVYETTMHVPLVLAGPKVPEGARFGSLVRTADVAPTVLDLLGLPPLEQVAGVSLTPLLRGESLDLELRGYGEATRFAATFGLPTLRFLRRGPWKYIHKVNPELYNVETDPGELENLADAHPEIVERLRGELEEMLAQAPPPSTDAQADLDAQTAAQLIALGYVAKSPAFTIGDERASLELRGDDPVAKVADIQVVSKASGLLSRREWGEAMKQLEGLRARNPDSTFVMDLSAQALVGLGRYPEAISLLERVRAEEPGNSEVVYSLAQAHEAQGRPEDALGLLAELAERSPCDERVRIDQYRILKDLARHRELMAMLEQGSASCPDMLIHRNNLAWSLATLPERELRDGPRAVEISRDVIRRTPQPNPAYLDTLSAALAESGDFDAAIRAGEQVINQLRAAGAPPEVVAEVTGHIDAYRAGHPVRDPVRAEF